MHSFHVRLGLCVASVLAAGAFVLAQEQPPAGEDPDGSRPTRQFDRWGGDRPWGFRRRGEISAEEWEMVSQFMQENFPNRWAVYQNVVSMPGREVLGREMKIRIVSRHRHLERVRRDNESLYNVVLDQARAEDAVWGTVRAWRELTEGSSEAERASTLEKLREEVRAMTLKTFDEREARLNSIRESLAREEKELAADRKRVDKLVEARVQTLTSDNPFRGPDGMGPTPDSVEREAAGERPDGERRGPPGRGERRGGDFAAPPQPE